MDFGTVTYTAKDRIATVTLNRPHRFNAIVGQKTDQRRSFGITHRLYGRNLIRLKYGGDSDAFWAAVPASKGGNGGLGFSVVFISCTSWM